MTLIADSGSTKTAWMLMQEGRCDAVCHTRGINPVLQTADEVVQLLEAELLPALPVQDVVAAGTSGRIFFYGAGCLPSRRGAVETALRSLFPEAEIRVDSDLLGAARALCGHAEGIACILGTGSNSCLFNGERIVQNVSPLGYVLGDEGSGAVLGRCLVGDLLKGCLPETLKECFLTAYGLTPEAIIEHVYRRPMPNRFLASFAPFLAQHREEPGIRRLLLDNFRLFFQRNVAAYARPDLAVHCTGSIAFFFADELSEAARREGFALGCIERTPLDGMVAYHRAD